MTNRIQSVVLILSGIVIGCGAAVGVKASWAGPTPGQWSCYKTDAFPDVDVDEDANAGMSNVATSVPKGTVVVLKSRGTGEAVCVRD
jgi:hypothetical protein